MLVSKRSMQLEQEVDDDFEFGVSNPEHLKRFKGKLGGVEKVSKKGQKGFKETFEKRYR